MEISLFLMTMATHETSGPECVFLSGPACLSLSTSVYAVLDKVKDYRYYLRMWALEKELKPETIKDLPRMNQVRSRLFS